jgi:threonyl-tRNA synthetase
MIHRAILGSVERMMAVLIEHTKGRWPLWLSPRQVMVVPVTGDHVEYAHTVRQTLEAEGLYVDVSPDAKMSLNKKIRLAQHSQYNYILVVGDVETTQLSVNVRDRDGTVHGTQSVTEFKDAVLQQIIEEQTFPSEGSVPQV